jgi:hypothetical protein
MTIDMDMPFEKFAEKHLKRSENVCAHGVPNDNICDTCELGPVPWRVGYKQGASYSQVQEKQTGNLIAEVYQSLENALFIAAAPEMYEALRAALDVMTSKKVAIEEQADAITAVRRALERAEGRR